MATWNELFLNQEFINDAPQAEIIKFIHNVRTAFPAESIKIWDLCCGAGRHSVLASKMGCDHFGRSQTIRFKRSKCRQPWKRNLTLVISAFMPQL